MFDVAAGRLSSLCMFAGVAAAGGSFVRQVHMVVVEYSRRRRGCRVGWSLMVVRPRGMSDDAGGRLVCMVGGVVFVRSRRGFDGHWS